MDRTRTSTDITLCRSHRWDSLFRPLLGLLLSLLLLSGCLAVPVGLRGVPPSWGELFDAHIAIVNYPVPESRLLKEEEWRPTLNRVLARIGPSARETCYLVGASHCELVGQQVYIVEDPTVNAYVDQGNVITVHSGLLHYAASDEEIAAVLAHEYGHIFADHIAKSIQNAEVGAAGAFLVSVLGEFNEMDDDEVEELAQDVYVMGATANSPQYELEADYYMALILENAGINLEHGKALLVRLARVGSDSVTSEQGGWGVNARLMARTHPADGPRIARWIAISNAMEWSRMAPPADDAELRTWAIEELVAPPISRGKSIRWINSENGHSGIVKIAAVRTMRKCETPNYFAQCIMYRHREFQMDGIGNEIRYVCSIPTDVRDDRSWSWWYMGTTPPWKKFSDGCPIPQFEHVRRHVPSE